MIRKLGLLCIAVGLMGASVGGNSMLQIDEAVINSLLSSIGPVSGTGNASVVNDYKWTIQNPKITFSDGVANFSADADIQSSVITTKAPVKGTIKFMLNESKTQLKLSLEKANLQLGMTVFGNWVPLTTLDVTKFYKPSFDVPIPLQTSEFSLDLPNGSGTFELVPTVESLQLTNGKLGIFIRLGISKKAPKPPSEKSKISQP